MKKNLCGFTLIELLVVVAILGIITTLAVPNFLHALVRAKMAHTYETMKTIQTAVAAYSIDYNSSPIDRGKDAETGNTYIPLTTPIPYLTSLEPCHDVFHTNNPDDLGLYFAYGAPQNIDSLDNPDRIASYQRAKITYFIFCWGPDRVPNWPWPNLDAGLYSLDTPNQAGLNHDGGIFFSPSNGLTSSGDILSTSSKIFQ